MKVNEPRCLDRDAGSTMCLSDMGIEALSPVERRLGRCWTGIV